MTWARIPHFYSTPYLRLPVRDLFRVGGKMVQEIMSGGEAAARRAGALPDAARSGGNDHPMELLRRRASICSQPETVRAVVDQLDSLVTRLERELESAK